MILTPENFIHYVSGISNRFQDFEDPEKIWQTANGIMLELGGSALNVAVTSDSGQEIAWARSSMTKEWLEHYQAAQYHLVDPFVDVLITGKAEVTADCGTLDKSDPAYQLNHDLKAFGYGSLFATACRNMASQARIMIVFCSADRLADIESSIGFDRLRIIHAVLASHIMVPVDRSGAGFLNIHTSPLSAKERNVLGLLARGLRNDQIAFAAEIAEVTVRKHLITIRAKLGADTREQAVAIAVKQGLIAP